MSTERWFSAGTDEPRDMQRDLDVPRGPEADAGYWAVIGPNYPDEWGWTVVDGINGEDVAGGKVPDEAAAKRAVANWETAYRHADEVMRQIDADIKAGTVPASVRSFSELHEHVDANGYLAIVPDLPDGTFDTDMINLVTREVTSRLEARSYKDGTVAELGGRRLTGAEALAAEENCNVLWDSELARVQAVADSGALMVMSDYPGFRLLEDGTVVQDGEV